MFQDARQQGALGALARSVNPDAAAGHTQSAATQCRSSKHSKDVGIAIHPGNP